MRRHTRRPVARIVATWQPTDEERAVVAEHLPEAKWLMDDPTTAKQAAVALMFWPRTELRKADIDWDELSALKYVKLATAGANHIGWSTLPARLAVAATPGATGPFIAEWILGAVLAWTRGLVYHTHQIKQGHFHLGAKTRAASELTIGFVGYGGIAQASVDLLAPLGARCMAINRSGASGDERLEWVGTMDQIGDLAAACDVLVVCCPLTGDTLRLIDMKVLSRMAMRPAMLVNVARGPIVNETDLFAWLDSDHTRHFAALDVWWKYPRQDADAWPYDDDFSRLPNVIMTPHCSPNVTGHRLAMLEAACQDLAKWETTGTMPGLVDREAHEAVTFDADPRG